MRQRSIFPIACDNCAARIAHPIWWRGGDHEYRPLCRPCVALGSETFTPESAIQQANAIVRDLAVAQ